ncbi:MAG: J domain-containing protein [Anaerolineae bacterium]
MTEDLYAVMGVAPTATQEQIDGAYRRLARQYHPDVNPAPEAVTRMQAINNAYAVLRDPERRTQYDRSRLPASRVSAPRAAAPAAGGYAPPRRAQATVERRSGTPDEMPKVLGAIIAVGLLIFLLTAAWVVTSARRVSEERAVNGFAPAAAAALATPANRLPTATPTSPVAAVVANVPRLETPTPARLAAAVATSPTGAPRATETATVETATPTPTETPTEEPTETVAPRPAGPPLALSVSDLYNEQENRAGGRRFQLKLNIRNEGQQTLNPPWRPRFLIYAGQRLKGWVDANYYGADKGGVDLTQQPAIKPGQEVSWAWYTVTLGPDEWVRQVEFDAQGWRWLWTFDNSFQNPVLSINRQ